MKLLVRPFYGRGTYETRLSMMIVGDLDFSHIDGFDADLTSQTQQNTKANRSQAASAGSKAQTFEPRRLSNGNWACNHKCKDKTGFVSLRR